MAHETHSPMYADWLHYLSQVHRTPAMRARRWVWALAEEVARVYRRKKAEGIKDVSGTAAAPPDEKDIEKDLEGEDDEDVPWDEMWEKGDYPFVRLEGNRAVCAICLMDFEEPKRVRGQKTKATAAASEGHAQNAEGPGATSGPSGPSSTEKEKDAEAQDARGAEEIQVEAVTEEERDALHLADAGEGAQPLRLLTCGHVFHVRVLFVPPSSAVGVRMFAC